MLTDHTVNHEETCSCGIPTFLWTNEADGTGTKGDPGRIFARRSVYQWRPSELS